MSQARRHLRELGETAQRAEAAEPSILARAEKKYAEDLALLDRACPGIEAAPDAVQQRYTDMVTIQR
ncbi:MAG: hypothetical protein EOO27_19980 [Comamonadaceae bacterium]|nr:MAG: hypothetical protein EOO27_19980 [Comamonadaceae bacterium]